jgi:hypothetical protein
MATKQELELRVTDLERDVSIALNALLEIRELIKTVDYSPSPVLERAPAYLLGRIHSTTFIEGWLSNFPELV